MWFSADSFVLTLAQAACIVLPAAGLPAWARRFRAPAWALVVPLSLVIVVGAIAALPGTADLLTWIALIGVPTGCALALGWAGRGSRPWLAVLAAPLLALAWATPAERVGQAAAVLLIVGSAVTLGRLLAAASALRLLKLGVIALAVLDATLVFSGNLEPSNDLLVAASPGLGLPRLQSASFGQAGIGYGDLFAAAVVGGILAVESRPRAVAAVALVAVSVCWDQLFLVYDVLPATIPPAIVLIGIEGWSRWGKRGRQRRSGPITTRVATVHRS